jgi:hypothetical protein
MPVSQIELEFRYVRRSGHEYRRGELPRKLEHGSRLAPRPDESNAFSRSNS